MGRRGAEIEREPRVTVAMLVQYRFDALEELVADYSANLSTTGIFVHTDEPRKVGTTVYLLITLREGARLIEGFGRVARVGRDQGKKGMGIQFVNLDEDSMALIRRVVAESGGGAGKAV
jgi:uncharacterized protein (TIGR02266 family)